MPDASDIERLRAEFKAVRAVRDRYLARKGGVVAALMKAVTGAAPADRPALGRLANEFKRDVEEAVEARRASFEAGRPAAGTVDVTLPGRQAPLGHLHPLTLVR